jgi:hypothetical protein
MRQHTEIGLIFHVNPDASYRTRGGATVFGRAAMTEHPATSVGIQNEDGSLFVSIPRGLTAADGNLNIDPIHRGKALVVEMTPSYGSKNAVYWVATSYRIVEVGEAEKLLTRADVRRDREGKDADKA